MLTHFGFGAIFQTKFNSGEIYFPKLQSTATLYLISLIVMARIPNPRKIQKEAGTDKLGYKLE